MQPTVIRSSILVIKCCQVNPSNKSKPMKLNSVNSIKFAEDRCLILNKLNKAAKKLLNHQEITEKEIEAEEESLPSHLKGAYKSALYEYLTNK